MVTVQLSRSRTIATLSTTVKGQGVSNSLLDGCIAFETKSKESFISHLTIDLSSQVRIASGLEHISISVPLVKMTSSSTVNRPCFVLDGVLASCLHASGRCLTQTVYQGLTFICTFEIYFYVREDCRAQHYRDFRSHLDN